jgi:hypothetical protein
MAQHKLRRMAPIEKERFARCTKKYAQKTAKNEADTKLPFLRGVRKENITQKLE